MHYEGASGCCPILRARRAQELWKKLQRFSDPEIAEEAEVWSSEDECSVNREVDADDANGRPGDR